VDAKVFNNILQGSADCLSCAIRSSVLFAGLNAQECDAIAKPIGDLVMHPAEVLYHAGAPAQAIYTVRSGLVKLVQYLPDGRQRIVRLLRSADVTGLEAMLGEPYQHDAVVLQRVELCRIPLDVVRALDERNPAIRKELMARWQRALTEADAWLTQLSTGSARARMARLLLRLVERGDRCNLFSREDMGAMLGVTTETASRIIAEFKRAGFISERGGDDSLNCDVPALRRVAAD
jgi:CRP-like cAMP-binding protein